MEQPAHPWFQQTVAALVDALAQAHAEKGPASLQPPWDDVAQFVLRQHGRMTDFLRTPLRAATLGFDLLGLARTGARFHRQPEAGRRAQIEAWRNSDLGFKRDLIRFYESLTALALFSRTTDDTAPACPAGESLDEVSGRVISSPTGDLRCEIAVIGSGPGGAITACLLAEAGRDVLLIEEGPFHRLDSCPPFSRQEMEQKYRNGGLTVALGKPKIAYVEGCCVGGGSEINSGLYHRTPPEILGQWRRDFQTAALNESDLLPHFEACERDVSVSPLPGEAPAASLKLHAGAQRLGWKSLEVPRWVRYDSQPGAAPRGRRQSMTETFVPRFLRAGGTLLPATRVRRLRQDGGGWRLEARPATAGTLRIHADAAFVCAGAVQTPALLLRSGIKQNLGNSLRVHPTVKVVAQFAEAVNAAGMGVPVHQVKEFAPRFSFGCSISTPAYLALGLLDHPSPRGDLSRDWPRMANYYAMITGEGRGTIRPLPGFRDPLVRYRLTAQDRRDLGDGLRKLCELLLAAGAVALYPSLTRGAQILRRDDLAKLPEVLPPALTNLMTIHLFSSCPMGEDRRRCATDSFGRLPGLANLRVNDASLLCTAPGVNPQGTIMAVARRNALHFLGKL